MVWCSRRKTERTRYETNTVGFGMAFVLSALSLSYGDVVKIVDGAVGNAGLSSAGAKDEEERSQQSLGKAIQGAANRHAGQRQR